MATLPQPEDAAGADVRGSNQRGVRVYNERLILTLLRRRGPLAKAEIARLTGLSPQTTSIIMRQLEEQGMIRRGSPVRGKVGQPSVPFSIDPDGALYLGLKIGRRSSELVLVDFVGDVRESRGAFYRYPTPDEVKRFVISATEELLGSLSDDLRMRVAGLGIAAPFELWNWPNLIGLPQDAMSGWRDRDLRGELAELYDFDVLYENDGNAAAAAELILRTAPPRNFVYIYLGYFVGGGLVLDGQLRLGPTGNAGALGSMPVAPRTGPHRQMIDLASIATLERRIDASGKSAMLTDAEPWDVPAELLDEWLDEAAHALAQCVVAAAALCDLDAAIVDGWLPAEVQSALMERLYTQVQRADRSGVCTPELIRGSFGSRARSIGAAATVLASRHMINHPGFPV